MVARKAAALEHSNLPRHLLEKFSVVEPLGPGLRLLRGHVAGCRFLTRARSDYPPSRPRVLRIPQAHVDVLDRLLVHQTHAAAVDDLKFVLDKSLHHEEVVKEVKAGQDAQKRLLQVCKDGKCEDGVGQWMHQLHPVEPEHLGGELGEQ